MCFEEAWHKVATTVLLEILKNTLDPQPSHSWTCSGNIMYSMVWLKAENKYWNTKITDCEKNKCSLFMWDKHYPGPWHNTPLSFLAWNSTFQLWGCESAHVPKGKSKPNNPVNFSHRAFWPVWVTIMRLSGLGVAHVYHKEISINHEEMLCSKLNKIEITSWMKKFSF